MLDEEEPISLFLFVVRTILLKGRHFVFFIVTNPEVRASLHSLDGLIHGVPAET